jgi:hypothetical protein
MLLAATTALATSPHVTSLLPTGAQRGTELEITFEGDRLLDTEEILSYEPGLEVLKLNLVTNKQVKAQLKLAPDCALGEHHLRLRTTTGLSEIRTFLVGPFPVVEEVEPNNEPGKAQKLQPNTTVTGVIKSEDVDCFAVEMKKDQRLSAEVEGMRLGRGAFDPRLTVLDAEGAVLAEVDDTWLGRQDPLVSLIVPKDGTYVIRVRDSTYGGADNYHYRLHIGSFPRPTAVFPPGGKAGQTVAFTFCSEATGEFSQQIALPATSGEKAGVFAELDGLTAPTPNWIRISDFPNVLSSMTNRDRDHAIASDQAPPLAFNGIIAHPGQEDWFRFPANKGAALDVTVYARRLHSPLDSVIEIEDSAGHSVASNDDAVGADSSLKFTPTESTNYFLRVRDTLGKGGRDFVYRAEITPVEPNLALKIPEVARNDTQSRQFIAVPRGNRFATLISAKRANFSSPLTFGIENLPTGVVMLADEMAKNIDAMPLVFEADTNAVLGCRLLELCAAGSNGTTRVTGKFRQNVELVEGPNNSSFFGTSVDTLCVAVVKEAPFHLRIVEPEVPLVQAGSMPLEIIAERDAGFDEPIQVQMVWNPPGVSSQPEATIAKGATNVIYQLNAGGGAETHTWKIAVLGHATVDGGDLYVSSQLAPLEVTTPFLSGKIETLWAKPGEHGKLTVNLQQTKPFEGKATIRLCGLPEKVTAPEREITKDDQEVVFDVQVEPNCGAGSHKNLFCAVDVKQGGHTIPHIIAQGGILRVVPPKKGEATVAKVEKK